MHFSAACRVLIQGVSGPIGRMQALRMRAYGTQIVAAVTPGQGGQALLDPIPLFDLVEQAVERCGPIHISVLIGPGQKALDAGLEAIAAGIRQLVILSQGMPPLDMVRLLRVAEQTETLVIGPNAAGVIVPGQLLLGIHPVGLYQPGAVALLSRSGTLAHEIAARLSQAGIGQSIAVGIGQDPIVGLSLPEWLDYLDEHEPTRAIVLVGHRGGSAEEEAAQYIAENIEKPIVAYIAGFSSNQTHLFGPPAPPLFWDAVGSPGTAQHKVIALQTAGVSVAEHPARIPELLRPLLPSRES